MGISSLFSICCTLLWLVSSTSITTADTLTPNQNLTDGQTLVSSNQRFALGFFSLGNSTDRYLGIWFNNLPLTVVWVANKANPMNGTSGRLTMNSDGGLFLYNRSMAIFWSANATVNETNPVLQLLGSGNLVIRSGESNGNDYIWQSFDHMSHTLLPGMRLGWNLSTRTNRYMTSWRSTDDPSDGEFTFSLDPPEAPQLILQRNFSKLYRWGPFDADRFSGSNPMRNNALFSPMFVSNSDEVYYTYEMLDDSTLSRLIVTEMGSIQYLTWRNRSRQWITTIEINRFYCDRYALCGPYGACYSDDPNCGCLNGFTPRWPEDWRLNDRSGGCRRTYELNCGNGDGFVRYTGLKLPDNAVVLSNYSLGECRGECLRRCDCMAYTAINVRGNGSQCVVWFGDLIDLRNLPDGGHDLYIRMAEAELDSIADARRNRRIRIIVAVIVPTIFVLLLFTLMGWYIHKSRTRKEKARISEQPAQDSSAYKRYDEECQEDDLELPFFDLAIVSTATDEFALENKLGQGGFGPVYKGVLPNGVEVAVKRLSKNSRQGLMEFKNEVILIAKLQHRNLVKLLGCCIEGEERMLVYEYLPNKSLDKFIFDQNKRKLLPWSQCFNIFLGIARGLLYLHQDSRLTIIHRDLKTSNILLDSEMNPKISDFGIARIFGGDKAQETTGIIIGTYGYMSPEYAMSGNFSVKSDAFSFGVIMLEIMSGRKNWRFHHPEHGYNLVGHAWKLWNEGKCLELLHDGLLEGSYPACQVKRCIQLALLCVQQRPEDRLAMCSVVYSLVNENIELPLPKEPGFPSETFSTKEDLSSTTVQDSSGVNEITQTTMEGR